MFESYIKTVGIVIAVALVLYIIYRYVHPRVHRYEYLSLLTDEWKLSWRLHKEMEKSKKGFIERIFFYEAMRKLCDEGLVEQEDGPLVEVGGTDISDRYYRITLTGKLKRAQLEESSPSLMHKSCAEN